MGLSTLFNSITKTFANASLDPLTTNVPHHIETSQLIYIANIGR